MKKDNEVQGTALYLEFRRAGATCQIVVTPDGFDNAGSTVTAGFFRRVLRPDTPKKRWTTFFMEPTHAYKASLAAHLAAETGDDYALVMDATETRLAPIHAYFESLERGGYTLVKSTPIYVEVSRADLAEVRSGSLPTKLWNRVKASRIALDFPTELVNNV